MKQPVKHISKYKTREKNISGYKKKHPRIKSLSRLYVQCMCDLRNENFD